MEIERYQVMPTELHHACCGGGSRIEIDQRWFRQTRYIRAMLDVLFAQKIITDKTAICIDHAFSELYSVYSDMQCAVRSETIRELKQDGVRPNCE